MCDISPSDVRSFQEDGVLLVRGLLSADEVDILRGGIDYNLANPSCRVKIASTETDTGKFFEDFCNWHNIPEYRQIALKPEIGRLAAKLMCSSVARLHHDHTLVKHPKTKQMTPWHQDQPYYNLDGHQNVSMWIPVDAVPLDSAMEFVRGTHKGPWLMPRTFKDNEAKWFREGSLAELPNIEANREAFPILSWELQPGDALCFNMLTLHGAKGSSSLRRAFSVRFIGDDVVHAPREWTTSPHFPGLEHILPPGQSFDHPMFPVVYRHHAQL